MKLGIFANFAYPHIGGSEMVIEAVAQGLTSSYGYDVTVYSCNQKSDIMDGKIRRAPCLRGPSILSQINENDAVWLYSDSFFEFDTLVRNLEKVHPRLSVALVGMYRMASTPYLYDLCLQNKDKFNFIEHLSSEAIKRCQSDGFFTKIIPNGVNLKEFAENRVDFRAKYNIVESNIVLNVSNFFYGKGQLALSNVCRKLKTHINDFALVQISSSIEYPHGERLRRECIGACDAVGVKHYFLQDIPREDVVGAFMGSDVFLFPSQKEVAPLVILECRAAKLPWVSFRVGDLEGQPGGTSLIGRGEKDVNGYLLLTPSMLDHMVAVAAHFIKFPRIRHSAIADSHKTLAEIDWSKIIPIYHEVFSR